MGSKTMLSQGLSILSAIAQTDTFKAARGAVRSGASKLADNQRLPKIVSGSASVVATLLEEHDDSGRPSAYDQPMPRPAEVDDADLAVATHPVDPEEDRVAAVRDLEETIDEHAGGRSQPAAMEDDDHERVLRFDEPDEDVRVVEPPKVDAPVAASPARSERPPAKSSSLPPRGRGKHAKAAQKKAPRPAPAAAPAIAPGKGKSKPAASNRRRSKKS